MPVMMIKLKSYFLPIFLLVLVHNIPSINAWYLFRRDKSISSPSNSLSDQSLADATKEVFHQYFNGDAGGVRGVGVSFSGSTSDGNNADDAAGAEEKDDPAPPPEISFLFPDLTSITANLNLPQFLKNALPSFIKSIIFYKPPVGLTSIYVLFNLLFSSRSNTKNILSRLLNEMTTDENNENDMNNGSRSINTSRIRKKRIGRSLELDEHDGKMMVGLGGVEAVRTELCIAALKDFIIDENNNNATLSSTQNQQQYQQQLLQDSHILSYYASAARDVLRINAPPMSSREDFVEKTIESLVKLQHYDHMRNNYHAADTGRQQHNQYHNQRKFMKSAHTLKSSIPTFTSSIRTPASPPLQCPTTSSAIDNANIVDIIWMSSTVAQIRTVDALLRTLRDRLVISAMRLSRKEKYRVWRLQWYETGFGRFFKQWMRRTMKNKTIDDDRRNLQLTRAALKRELERLGQVQGLLLNRPCEMSETRLLTSIQATINEQGGNDSSNDSSSAPTSKYPNNSSGTLQEKRKASGTAGCIDGAAARQALFRSECNLNRRDGFKNYNQGNNKTSNRRSGQVNDDSLNALQKWTLEAQEWIMQGRGVIAELVTETISDVFEPSSCLTRDRHTNVESDLKTLAEWASGNNSCAEDWHTVLALFDCLSKARLMREYKYLPSPTDLKYWLKRFDIFGIPSSLATVGASLIVHNTLKPYWPGIVAGGKVAGKATWGVIQFRFVAPLKDIALDLLNRRPKLLDPFELTNEETSLDNMLRDLGIGDGTKEGRKEAVATASRMYESEMAQGAIRNFLRGEMVRLLLIQVQQLKTGLLAAMGSIDDLIDANRLNVQLLATIPAILLVTFGTRLFFRALYGLRSKDIVGLPSAHAEMKDLLMKMERSLLLSSHTEDNNLSEIGRDVFLKPNELGEFVLHMHSYLSILDFCSPPFPTKTCDSIHSEMQELLMQGQLSTKRQIALLKLIGAKHDDLLKSI